MPPLPFDRCKSFVVNLAQLEILRHHSWWRSCPILCLLPVERVKSDLKKVKKRNLCCQPRHEVVWLFTNMFTPVLFARTFTCQNNFQYVIFKISVLKLRQKNTYEILFSNIYTWWFHWFVFDHSTKFLVHIISTNFNFQIQLLIFKFKQFLSFQV